MLPRALFTILVASAPAYAQLDKWAKAAGLKYFGTAVDNPALGNQAYMAIARDPEEFGAITPANGQKWSLTEPGQGSFSFGSGDAIANIVKQSGQMLRCHTLVWYNQLPGWGTSGNCRLSVDKANRARSANLSFLSLPPIQSMVGRHRWSRSSRDISRM